MPIRQTTNKSAPPRTAQKIHSPTPVSASEEPEAESAVKSVEPASEAAFPEGVDASLVTGVEVVDCETAVVVVARASVRRVVTVVAGPVVEGITVPRTSVRAVVTVATPDVVVLTVGELATVVAVESLTVLEVAWTWWPVTFVVDDADVVGPLGVVVAVVAVLTAGGTIVAAVVVSLTAGEVVVAVVEEWVGAVVVVVVVDVSGLFLEPLSKTARTVTRAAATKAAAHHFPWMGGFGPFGAGPAVGPFS